MTVTMNAAVWLAENEEPLVVPGPVITETCYFVERNSGPKTEAEFLASFDPGAVFERTDLATVPKQ